MNFFNSVQELQSYQKQSLTTDTGTCRAQHCTKWTFYNCVASTLFLMSAVPSNWFTWCQKWGEARDKFNSVKLLTSGLLWRLAEPGQFTTCLHEMYTRRGTGFPKHLSWL